MEARLSRRRTPRLRGREIFPALLLFLALGAVPRPAAAQTAGSDTLTLIWTAPGDDGSVGTAARYEVRLSTSPITSTTWDQAWLIGGAPAPLPSGAHQSVVVRGLTRGTTYYFAIKAIDDADNVSVLSNVVRWDWIIDTSPPSAPTGVAASIENGSEARVHWTANSEADLAGYTVYRKLTSGGSFQPVSPSGLTSTQFIDGSIPAGTAQVWYQISATDVSGNESARSASIAVSFGATTVSVFDLKPAYPNPTRVWDAVNIPINLPTGVSAAELWVMDSGDRRIRRLPLSGLSGPQVVVWDGRNDAGIAAAPGVYTAWLIGGGQRRSIKLVRQP
jgi:hypothetical protein